MKLLELKYSTMVINPLAIDYIEYQCEDGPEPEHAIIRFSSGRDEKIMLKEMVHIIDKDKEQCEVEAINDLRREIIGRLDDLIKSVNRD